MEHDKEMITEADFVADIGPGAGRKGGYLVFSGKPSDMLKSDSLTSQYINGKLKIEVPKSRREISDKKIIIRGAKGHNLKNIDLEIPLGNDL